MDTSTTLLEHGNLQSSFDYFMKFDIPKDAKILDVGCYFGSLLHRLYQEGYKQVYGIDIREQPVLDGRRAYPVLADRILLYEGNVLPYEEGTFDIVLMFDVIEHVPNIDSFLAQQVNRVMKPGGRFIFQTPNKIINVPWEIIHKKSFTAYKSFHMSLQTRGSLQKLLEKTNFSQIVIEKYNITTDHNLSKMKEKIGFIAKPLLFILQRLPLSLTPNFWGSSIKI